MKRRYARDNMAALRLLGAAPTLSQEEQMQINLPVRIAFERVRTGAAQDGDFDTMAGAINVSMVCAERIHPLVERTCTDARDALVRMHARHTRLGAWGLDGPGLQQVADAIDVYEQLTALMQAEDLRRALAEALRRMAAGHVVKAAA